MDASPSINEVDRESLIRKAKKHKKKRHRDIEPETLTTEAIPRKIKKKKHKSRDQDTAIPSSSLDIEGVTEMFVSPPRHKKRKRERQNQDQEVSIPEVTVLDVHVLTKRKKKKKHKNREHERSEQEPSSSQTVEPSGINSVRIGDLLDESDTHLTQITEENFFNESGFSSLSTGNRGRSEPRPRDNVPTESTTRENAPDNRRRNLHGTGVAEERNVEQGDRGVPEFFHNLRVERLTEAFVMSDDEDGEGAGEEAGSQRSRLHLRNLGKWTSKEDDILTANWRSFLEDNDVEDPYMLLCDSTCSKEQRRVIRRMREENGFNVRLAVGLRRSQYAIYVRARKLFHAGREKKVTEEDLKHLTEIRNGGGHLRWAAMAQELQVSGQKLVDFVRHMNRKKKGTNEVWTTEDDDLLCGAIRKVVGSIDHIDGIPWGQVCEHVPGKNDRHCRNHWMSSLYWRKKYNRDPRPFTDADQIELIQELGQANVHDEFFINWLDVRARLTSQLPTIADLKREWLNMKRLVPGFIVNDFELILEWLEENHVPRLEARVARAEEEPGPSS